MIHNNKNTDVILTPIADTKHSEYTHNRMENSYLTKSKLHHSHLAMMPPPRLSQLWLVSQQRSTMANYASQNHYEVKQRFDIIMNTYCDRINLHHYNRSISPSTNTEILANVFAHHQSQYPKEIIIAHEAQFGQATFSLSPHRHQTGKISTGKPNSSFKKTPNLHWTQHTSNPISKRTCKESF